MKNLEEILKSRTLAESSEQLELKMNALFKHAHQEAKTNNSKFYQILYSSVAGFAIMIGVSLSLIYNQNTDNAVLVENQACVVTTDINFAQFFTPANDQSFFEQKALSVSAIEIEKGE